jgi:hypothetical protein
MRNEVSVEIGRPIDDVFRLATEHMPEWSIIVIADEVIDQQPEGWGQPFARLPRTTGNGWSSRGSSHGTIRPTPMPFD